MTIEIRELVIQVHVTEPEQSTQASALPALTAWDEQLLLEKLKREILEYLMERGRL